MFLVEKMRGTWKAVAFCFPSLVAMGIGSAAVQAQEPSGNLLIYLGHGSRDAQPVVELFMEKYPAVNVTLFEQPTGQLVTTLQLEVTANRNRADLIWGGGVSLVGFGEQNPDVIASYMPSELIGVPESLRSADERFHTVATIPYVIGYNTNMIAAMDAPTSWLDLTDPRWDGMMAMADPATASAVHPYIWYVTTYLADREGFGEAYWDGIAANRPHLTPGHGELGELLITGERALAPVTITQMETQLGLGEPVAYNWATEGSPTSDSVIAIIEQAPNREAAEAFVSWILSPEGQEAITVGFDNVPVNPDFSPTFFDGSTAADHEIVIPDNSYLSENIQTQVQIVQNAMEAVR